MRFLAYRKFEIPTQYHHPVSVGLSRNLRWVERRCESSGGRHFSGLQGGVEGYESFRTLQFPSYKIRMLDGRAARCLSVGGQGGRADEARDAAHVAPQLRDASIGERN
jgi:hypothetical protein